MGRPVLLAAGAASVSYVPAAMAARWVLGPGWGAVTANVTVGAALHLTILGPLRRELDLDRLVAIKILRPELLRERDVVERFESEAGIQARLLHDNVARVYEFTSERAMVKPTPVPGLALASTR